MSEEYLPEVELDPVGKLARDVRVVAKAIDRPAAGYLVDMYYRLQHERITTDNQVRTLDEQGLPVLLHSHFADQYRLLEKQVKAALAEWIETREEGRWATAQPGIGPVLAAGLSAHIDISRSQTAGQIWAFAGMDPNRKWGKGEKRPWNADLKVLIWKIGRSFVYVSNREGAFYGKVYKQRKALEVERNNAGLFAAQAKIQLETKNIRDAKLKATLESGKLADGHIQRRAERYAAKLFIAHWFEVAYEAHYGTKPPSPYPIAHLGHAHYIAPPEGKK